MSANPEDRAGEQPCDYWNVLPRDASDYDRGVVEWGLAAEEQDWLRRQRREWEARCGGGPLSAEELVDRHTIDVVPARWARFAEHLPFETDGQARLSLTRRAVTDVARECRGSGAWLPLLVTSFAWGWGTRGFGPARLSWILSGRGSFPGLPLTEIANRLAAAVDVLDQQGTRASYELLLRGAPIRGFGPAFFTKFLYFVSRADNARSGALILDARLAGQMRDGWKGRADQPYPLGQDGVRHPV